MSTVTDIWLFVQTATSGNANSGASLQLNVASIKLPTSSQQNSANTLNKLGAPAQFHWSQNTSVWPTGAVTTDNITGWSLQIVGSNSGDAWVPSSIWVVYLTDTGQYVLGPQNPNWPTSQCFSTQSSDCGGKAKATWQLPWSLLAPVVEFTSGGITENELEPSESATYQFNAVNLSPAMTINAMIVSIVYDQQQYQENGITIGLDEIGPNGYPQIIVPQSLPPGGSAPISFSIFTNNTPTGAYSFTVSLLSWQLGAATTDGVEVYLDEPHQFSVVPS